MAKTPSKTAAKTTTKDSAATTTTRTTAAPATRARATTTETGPVAFDAKANKAATVAERAARTSGTSAEKTTRHTVLPGQAVRKGGVRYTEGEAVDLSAADAERLVAKMKVAPGDAGAKAVKDATTKADTAAADAAAAADAQRIADEEAAKARAAEAEAKGELSGAENR